MHPSLVHLFAFAIDLSPVGDNSVASFLDSDVSQPHLSSQRPNLK